MRTKDGEVLVARSAEGLISELRSLSLTPSNSDRQFMETVAHRVRLQTGKPVRTKDAAEFIADLMRAGLLYDEDSH